MNAWEKKAPLNTPVTVSVGTTATLIVGAGDYALVSIRNSDASASVFWGDENVTASSTNKGQELKAGEGFRTDLISGDIYAITASGTVDVSVVTAGGN